MKHAPHLTAPAALTNPTLISPRLAWLLFAAWLAYSLLMLGWLGVDDARSLLMCMGLQKGGA